jgi:multiple sugar transport system substrate-binding protein
MKRLFAALVTILLAAVACSSGGGETTTSGSNTGATAGPWSLAQAAAPYKGVELRVLDEITDLQPTFATLVPQFEQETGIKVTYELKPHPDVITVGESDLFSGSGTYDAVMLHRFQFPNAISAEAIQYIDPYLSDSNLHDPSVSFDSFIQPLTNDGYMFGDNHICFPDWNYNQVWIGRKDLLENPDEQSAFNAKYGYDLAPPQTLQQMKDIAEFFTRKPGDKLAGKALSQPFYGFTQDGNRQSTNWQDSWFNYLINTGGDLFDSTGAPTANDPKNVAGLELWKSMFQYAPPGASEVSLVDLPVIVGQSRVASAIAYSDFFFTLDSPGGSAVAGKLVYAPVPADADNPSAHTAAYTPSCDVINNASQNKEATYLFLQWLISQPTQDALLGASLQEGGFDPVLQSSLTNSDFTTGPRASLNAAIGGSLTVGKAYPLLLDLGKAIDVILQDTQEYLLDDQMSAQQALDKLQDDLTAICSSNCLLVP